LKTKVQRSALQSADFEITTKQKSQGAVFHL
jgi:hypothetical protein